MKTLIKSDTVWCIVLIALPVLALLVSLFPGSIRLYDAEAEAVKSYFLFSDMPSDMMATTVPLIVLIPLYVVVLGVFYLKSQKLNTLKALLIFTVFAALVAWVPLLVEPNLQPLPYIVIPGILTTECLAAYIRFKIEDSKYEY